MSGKLITVFLATGNQGNAVAKALLANKYKVRAVTRNPDGAKAKELQGLGAELAQVKDMNNVAELEQAIKGSYGVFAVTNYWGMIGDSNPVSPYDREIAQGKAIADICKSSGVQHLVYSGLDHVKEIMGKPCPHFDSKAIVDKYINEIGVPNTIVRYPYYFDNFAGAGFAPQKQEDGTYTLTLATAKAFDGIAVADGGPVVAAIFDDPGKYIGKKIGLSGEKLHMNDYCSILSKVLGKTIRYNQIPYDVFAQFPFPGADDIAAMFEFYDFKDGPDRSIELTHTLNPATLGFEAWAQQNKDKIPL